MEAGKIICRLCLETCKPGFELIKDSTKETLNLLLLNLNLEISHEPVVCNGCVNNLKHCFNFKIDYLRKSSNMSIKHEDIGLKAPEVYLTESAMDTPKMVCTSDICWSCKGPINHETSVLLMKEEKGMETILEKYFPELVVNSTMDSMCISCYKSLQNQLAFINNCLTVEAKIEEYCKAEGTNNKGQIELNDVVYFVSKNQLHNNIYSSFATIKMEEKCEETEYKDKFKIKNENLVEIDEPGICSIEKQDIDIKIEQTDGDRFNTIHATPKNLPEVSLPNKADTTQATRKFYCEVEKVERCMRAHTQLSKTKMYKCKLCAYQSKQKGNLSKHTLTHKNPSEVKMYQCDICTYQSKHKYRLSEHMLDHKDPSEVVMYRCKMCTYKTRQKYRLSEHMVTHKDLSEVEMYKCEVCTYQSKRKYNLSRHILTHKNPSEATMYKCTICTFQSRHRSRLSEHKMTHQDPSEVVIYKCELCTYQSIHKNRLSKHMLVHKDSSEVVMYECEICTYQSRYKHSLSEHMLTHKDLSEVLTYKCELCTYQGKRKGNLTEHMLTHKDPSEVITFNCEICAYKTRRKRNLSLHMLVHKDPSELIMYKCELCTFQSKRKDYISTHMLTHKDPSEVVMFMCETCGYQAKRKHDISKHVLTHKNGLG